MTRRRPAGGDLKRALRGLARLGLRRTAIAAFLIGVALHACVALTILDDGKSSGPPLQVAPVVPTATATPSGPPDRTSCEEIRNTDYRSTTERDWFRSHCITPVPG